MGVDTNLKSVDGSLPCHPISFHCSDINPWSSRLGYVAVQRALKASCWHEVDLISSWEWKQYFIKFIFHVWLEFSMFMGSFTIMFISIDIRIRFILA